MKSIPITGYHAIEELLRKGGVKGSLYLEADRKKTENLRPLAEEARVPVIISDKEELERLSGVEDHRGAVLFLEEIPFEYRNNLGLILQGITKPNALVLLLDGITDPQNFGAILRSADQFEADCIVITERRSAHETHTVLKTSAGASSYVTLVTVPNLSSAIEILKQHEFWIYGSDMEGQSVSAVNLKGKTALVLGREGQGLHRLVRESCDGLVAIPAKGHVDSFNVSVAAGILMYEVRRQQGKSGK